MKMTSAQEEYEKNPELNRKDITDLQKWCEAQTELPEMSERDLIVFHHSCSYELETTKQCIENYFKIRSKNPTYFSNRDPESVSLRKAMDTVGYYVLDGLTDEGYRVILVRLIKTSPSAYVFNDVLKLYTMVADGVFNTAGSAAGDLIVYDMTGTGFGHLPRLNVAGFKNMLQYVQEGLPVRLKGIYMINAIPFVDIVINMMTPFMKKELMDMFHVTSSAEVLSNLLPVAMLPQDYGGKGKSLADLHEQTVSLINEQRQFYIEDDKRRLSSLSKKATEDTKISSAFRKLEVD
ncbi:hypothetical protein M8J77_012580 [Diaphorina citri]|nr:hypothetical protein M8J77_012580 [Diaphorina citri]